MSQTFRIGVDARPLTSPMSGVARVISNVIRFFPDRQRFHFVLYASRPWHSDFAEIIDLPNVTWVQGEGWMAKRAGLWYNFRLPVILRTDPVDLFWGSQQVIPPGMSRDNPVLLTCYDLVSTFYPDTMRPLARMQQRAVMRLSMRRADSILAISTQTRDDTVAEYEYPAEKAGVALLGYEMPEVPVGEEHEQLRGEVALRLGFRPKENFILAVSTIEPRKNYGVLLDAYMQYYRRVGLRAYPLVIAGRRGWETPEFFRKLEDYQRECGRIYTLEGLTDRHLNELYRSCGFFCMPSLYEGFGLPLLEALCNGRLALASDIPCFHEIGGDSVTYLPADDVEAWSVALEEATIATMPPTQKNKKRPVAGPDFPATDWGWDRTAAIYHREFLQLLEGVDELGAANPAADLREDPVGLKFSESPELEQEPEPGARAGKSAGKHPDKSLNAAVKETVDSIGASESDLPWQESAGPSAPANDDASGKKSPETKTKQPASKKVVKKTAKKASAKPKAAPQNKKKVSNRATGKAAGKATKKSTQKTAKKTTRKR